MARVLQAECDWGTEVCDRSFCEATMRWISVSVTINKVYPSFGSRPTVAGESDSTGFQNPLLRGGYPGARSAGFDDFSNFKVGNKNDFSGGCKISCALCAREN